LRVVEIKAADRRKILGVEWKSSLPNANRVVSLSPATAT
jgi:hypothetical protein